MKFLVAVLLILLILVLLPFALPVLGALLLGSIFVIGGLLAALAVAIGIISAGGQASSPPQPVPIVQPQSRSAPSTAAAPGTRYSAATVWWDWSNDAQRQALHRHCDTDALWQLRPAENAEEAACVAAAMREAGASPAAVRFFEQSQSKLFLVSFQKRDAVDTGTAAAPWVNMGRPEPVFLNGSPAIMVLSEVTPRE